MAPKKISKIYGIDLNALINFYNLTNASLEKEINSAIRNYNYGRGIEMSGSRVGKIMEFIKLMIK